MAMPLEFPLRGSITALATPFKGGEIDEDAFCALVERQIAAGSHGLVPVGSTGEAPTLSHQEHRRIIELCIASTAGKVPVIAGAGSNSSREAQSLAQFAKEAGADAILVATGYYNKPTQEGLYAHFKRLNDAIGLPIIIYNVPGRTIIDISVETMARLSQLPHVIAVKDATGDLARVPAHNTNCVEGFIQLSGEDITAVGFNAMGGTGCISVSANIAPALCAELQEATLAGDYKKAVRLQDRLTPLHNVLFNEPNPTPVKYALSRLGLCTDEMRMPLLPMTQSGREAVDKVLSDLELLKT